MSDYTPQPNEVRADFITLHTRNFDAYQVGRSLTSEQEVYGGVFDRMIAEVERAAAEKALIDAAEAFEGGEIRLDAFSDPATRELWSYSNETRRNLVLTLRDRAEAYRQERKEP